jgi:hypothetical protein
VEYILILSILHTSDLILHILNPLLEVQQLLSQSVLVIAQVVGVFLHPLEQGLVVTYRLIHVLLVLSQIFIVDLSEVV